MVTQEPSTDPPVQHLGQCSSVRHTSFNFYPGLSIKEAQISASLSSFSLRKPSCRPSTACSSEFVLFSYGLYRWPIQLNRDPTLQIFFRVRHTTFISMILSLQTTFDGTSTTAIIYGEEEIYQTELYLVPCPKTLHSSSHPHPSQLFGRMQALR